MVISDHRPEDLEHHDVEFMLSPEGMASLPSSFAMALSGLMETAQPEEALNSLLRALTNGTRNLLTLPLKHIDVGSDCDITWFHPNATHVPHIGTRGVNLPPFREGLKGHVLGVFKDDRAWLASARLDGVHVGKWHAGIGCAVILDGAVLLFEALHVFSKGPKQSLDVVR